MKGPEWPLPTDIPSEHKKGPGCRAISGLIVLRTLCVFRGFF